MSKHREGVLGKCGGQLRLAPVGRGLRTRRVPGGVIDRHGAPGIRTRRTGCRALPARGQRLQLDRNLQTEHERVARLAEAAGLDDVLNIRLHGKFLGDLDDVARVEDGLEGAGR